MSKWTHSICDECWLKKNPDREPVRITNAPSEVCCYCGKGTTSGIYVRDDPRETLCAGEHGKKSLGRFCPSCGRLVDADSVVPANKAEEISKPKPGDVSVCFYCGDFLVFEEDDSLRKMSFSEEMELPDNIRSRLFSVRQAIRKKGGYPK